MIFHQLFEKESSTYTYLLADEQSKEAVLIDPVVETIDRDLKLIEELGLKIKYVLDTHIHADHVTAAGEIRRRTGARTAVSYDAQVDCVDIPLRDGSELEFGRYKIKALSTPGHTDSCMSFYCDGKIFTGDALLIRGTGRTDFQQGSAEKLYHSVTGKIFNLPAETEVFPAHDYRGQTKSSVALEKQFNPRIGGEKTLEEFKQIMSQLKLDHPKKIHEALPANMTCGIKPDAKDTKVIAEINVEQLKPLLGKVRLIDVRRPDEFDGELGHIPGAELVTLGEGTDQFLLNADREQKIVFVCRSGARSGRVTEQALSLGYKNVLNMVGGMLRWNELQFPIERKG